ncbi:unnamed protein product [Mycena citricolor]|uniref:Uncharacterized protein n=1 Tax=Mycena citricolor TaxID=2018698 RepID=A0AAD2Q178_9AGAR|nr:unnamed protein product [Mycena citricolor]
MAWSFDVGPQVPNVPEAESVLAFVDRIRPSTWLSPVLRPAADADSSSGAQEWWRFRARKTWQQPPCRYVMFHYQRRVNPVDRAHDVEHRFQTLCKISVASAGFRALSQGVMISDTGNHGLPKTSTIQDAGLSIIVSGCLSLLRERHSV